MAAANSVAKNLWNKETSELPTTIAASASTEPTTAKTLQTEHIIDLELNDAEKAMDLNQNTKLTNRKLTGFRLWLSAESHFLGSIFCRGIFPSKNGLTPPY
jgi:hypothetical protein